MELYVMDQNFNKTDVIDSFVSLIWTERYYGDSEFQIVVQATSDNIQKLTPGTLILSSDSLEVMMIETQDIEQNLTIAGISMVQWLNNRFIRFSKDPAATNFNLYGYTPGFLIVHIVKEMCIHGSDILAADDTDDVMGVSYIDKQRFIVPNLHLGEYDNSGDTISMAIPYGPVYDAISNIAKTYKVGMQITLDSENNRYLFRTYRGIDRTSDQRNNAVVRFSPETDTFSKSKEIISNKNYKNMAFAWSSAIPDFVGKSELTDEVSGLDLRVAIKIDSSITGDQTILDHTAKNVLSNNDIIKAVDGEVVMSGYFNYGDDYSLGDLVEVQGNSGIVNSAMVTEHIYTEDTTGSREYPTVAIINPLTVSSSQGLPDPGVVA